MAYTPPVGDAVDFDFAGSAYTPPVGDAVDFDFAEEVPAVFGGLFLALFVGE